MSALLSTLIYDFYCVGRGKLCNFKIQNVSALLEYFDLNLSIPLQINFNCLNMLEQFLETSETSLDLLLTC